MALFQESLVAVDNPKFPRVYAKWCIDVMLEMHEQSPTYSFIDNIEFWIATHDTDCNTAIKTDLAKMVKRYANTLTQHVVIGYDTKTFSGAEIWVNVKEIAARKTKKDYEMNVIGAFPFTENLSHQLLDNPIPDLTLVLVNFTRPRNYI